MKQSGFTIVEAMISVLIGIILLAGSMQIFISSKDSFRLQEAISLIQDDARFVMHFITRDLRHAGYPREDLGVDEAAGEALAFDIISNNATSNNTQNDSDQIAVQYEANNDCTGNVTPSKVGFSTVTVNKYYLDGNVFKCSGNSGNTIDLAENIERFHVLYGRDTDNDGIANSYLTANNITGVAAWNSVVSVRFALLFASESDVGVTLKTFNLLNEVTYTPPDDGKLRRVFISTVVLRNR